MENFSKRFSVGSQYYNTAKYMTEILEDYPHLTKKDIHACLRYAARSCKNEIYVELEPVTA